MKKNHTMNPENNVMFLHGKLDEITEYLLRKDYTLEAFLGHSIYRKAANVIKIDSADPENSSTKLKVTFYSIPPHEFGIKKEAAFVINNVEELEYILNTLLK